MSAGFNVQGENLSFNKALNKLAYLKNELTNEIDNVIGARVRDMETLAKQLAPSDIKNKIYVNNPSILRYELIATGENTAYIEFGTGNYYKQYESVLTPEWKKIASTFYKNGKGTIPQQPYFYPSVRKYMPILKKEVKEILKAK